MNGVFCIVFFLAVLVLSVNAQRCECASLGTDEATRSGGNELVTVIERRVFADIRGSVRDVNDLPLDDVLIEVYDRPSWIKEGKSAPTSKQKRILGCSVGEKGEFMILGLKKGEYELRISKGLAWNVTHLYLKIDPEKAEEKSEIVIYLEVGS